MGCGGVKEEKEVDSDLKPEKKERKAFDPKAPKRDDEGKYLRPLDADFQSYFDKYDDDCSGTMNHHDEIRQLAMNMLTSGLRIREFKGPDIRAKVEALPEDTCWSLDEYKEWFYKEFNFSAKSLADYSQLNAATKHVVDEIEEKMTETRELYGKRGEDMCETINDVYAFIEDEAFEEESNKIFTDAAGEADEMDYEKFEDGVEDVFAKLLEQTSEIGDDDGKIHISKDDVKEWFGLVDADESGKVSKGEFCELLKFFCLNFKLDTLNAQMDVLAAAPKYTDFNEQFRMGGNCFEDGELGGFTLVRGKHQRAFGHFLCRVPFEADGDTYVKFKYLCNPKAADFEADKEAAINAVGEGLVVYLADPEAEEWDEHFDGEGPCGFQGKKGGVFGVFLDAAGNISGGKDQVAIKGCDPAAEPIKAEAYGKGIRTKQGKWRKVQVHFNIDEGKVNVKVGGKKVIDGAELGDSIKIPKKIVCGICAGTSKNATAKFTVGDLHFENTPDDDEDESSDEE